MLNTYSSWFNYPNYSARAIIIRDLYIYHPIFEVHFFVFKENFSENSVLMNGQYSRAVCNQERFMMQMMTITKRNSLDLYNEVAVKNQITYLRVFRFNFAIFAFADLFSCTLRNFFKVSCWSFHFFSSGSNHFNFLSAKYLKF